MIVSDVKIRKIFSGEPLKAVCSITLDNSIAVHDIKIVDVGGKLIVAMPSRNRTGGDYSDIVHPINSKARFEIETALMEEYRRIQSLNIN